MNEIYRPPRFTDRELNEIFPEAKEIILMKIKELETARAILADSVKDKLRYIENISANDLSKWFWREWIKCNEGTELLNIDKNIKRLNRFIRVNSGKVSKDLITDEEIQQALQAPIENLVSTPLKKCGKTLSGICPLHQEKHPSFYIYPETNSFYCFGCNQGGDSIRFIRLLHNYSFQEAVNYLNN